VSTRRNRSSTSRASASARSVPKLRPEDEPALGDLDATRDRGDLYRIPYVALGELGQVGDRLRLQREKLLELDSTFAA
jgi:hypothetical protein